jgi:hypothetical protein
MTDCVVLGTNKSSWPGLSRPSTSYFREGVDARDKRGHDGLCDARDEYVVMPGHDESNHSRFVIASARVPGSGSVFSSIDFAVSASTTRPSFLGGASGVGTEMLPRSSVRPA